MSGSGGNVATTVSVAAISSTAWCSTLADHRVPTANSRRDGSFQVLRGVRYLAFPHDGSRLAEDGRGKLISARHTVSGWRRTRDPIASSHLLSEIPRRRTTRTRTRGGGGRCAAGGASNWEWWASGGRGGGGGGGGGGGRLAEERMELDVCLRRCHHDLDACRAPGCRAIAGKAADTASSGRRSKAGKAMMDQRQIIGGGGGDGGGDGNVVVNDDHEQMMTNGGHGPVPLSATLKTCAGVVDAGSLGSQSWSELRVGYQGVPGAYSEAAAHQAYPNCEAVPCDQFDATFQAVEQWAVDRAVLPVENSLGGSIHRNYDLLLRHRLHIVGEVMVEVHHCLLALPGVKMEEVKKVVSHPQALAQCERTLTSLLGPGITREALDDTAGAAKQVAQEKLRDTAAIASTRAGMIYGLSVLKEGIQDNADNITRFIALAREPLIPHVGADYKTSIVFTLEEGPGVLFKALAVFALRGINLTKIESRPQRNRPIRTVNEQFNGDTAFGVGRGVLLSAAGEGGGGRGGGERGERGGGGGVKGYGNRAFDYLFYVDFQASMAEPRAQNALRNLEEFAPFLRVLGSYPASQ